jgi:uncharacterized protein (DUF2236 family)
MQIAHPLVAEGVDQHSSFREDPWARLQATLRSYLAIVYGSTPVARAEIARLRRLHRPVRGPVRDETAAARFGPAYAATDPDLALWVHATLVDSTMAAYGAWLEPLTRERAARFYRETLPVGRALGVPSDRLPGDLAAFQAYLAAMLGPDGPVHPSAISRELADHILHPTVGPLVPSLRPFLERIPPPLYDWTLWPAVALLPPTLREEYGIAWSQGRSLVATWLLAGWRGWRPLIPTMLRWMPQARAADRRVDGRGLTRTG